MSAIASFLQLLRDLFSRLFGSPPPPSEAGVLQPLEPRVLMIVYNPLIDTATGKKLIETLNWNDPDTLASRYIQDLRECSAGLAKYKIVERVEVDEFPTKQNGFAYQPQQYVNAYLAGSGLDETMVDYQPILAKFKLLQRVANNELDEVWIFNYPGAGFYESTMAGKGAFFCNSEPLLNTAQCQRRFVLMGFSPERGIGEMEEAFGHRAESILARVFKAEAFLQWTYDRNRVPPQVAGDAKLKLFERYLCFDQIAPGQANIGTIHYAPNSTRDYEWGNMKPVTCYCDDWNKFPNFTETARVVDSQEWGGGDIRLHHTWWLKHLPKVAGTTDGIANNWWKYVVDPNNVRV